MRFHRMRFTRPLAGPAALVALVSTLALAGCSSNVSTDLPAGNGTLKVGITDDPVDVTQITHLFVTFDRLYLFPARADSDSAGTPPPAPVEVMTAPVTVDLVELNNGFNVQLGAANLPEGRYRSMNLVVTTSWLIEADGDTQDVLIPSGDTRGLKIVTDFTVTAGQISEITLDFDAAASLHEAPPGSGRYVLRPVIRQLPERPLAASISGTILVETESGLIPAGEVLVPNPRFGRRGRDEGHGPRPGRGSGGRRDSGDSTGVEPRLVPLPVAWPMLVHVRPDSAPPDDSANVAVRLPFALLHDDDDDDDDDRNLDPGHPNRPRATTTIVGPRGNYTIWRARKGQSYSFRLHLFPRSGYEIVSGPPPLFLSGDVTGADFVIRARVDTGSASR